MSAYKLLTGVPKTPNKNNKQLQRVGFIMCKADSESVRREIYRMKMRNLNLPHTYIPSITKFSGYISTDRGADID